MPPTAGKNWFVEIQDPSFVRLANQRGGSLALEADGIDIASKDDAAWASVLPGIKSWSIELDGLIVESNQAFQAMIDGFNTDAEFVIQVIRPDGKVFRGIAHLTSFPQEFAHDAAATYSATFTGKGAPTHFWVTP